MSIRATLQTCAGLAVTIAVALTTAGCLSGASAADQGPGEEVTRDDISVSVGGVGRIVHSGAVTSTQGSGTSGGTQAPAAPVNAVYPQTGGTVLKYVVAPGQRVASGQSLLQLDDGGTAAAALQKAQSDQATARYELAQLLGSRSSDLSAAQLEVRRAQLELETVRGGTSAARARAIRAAKRNVELAQGGLDRVLAPPHPADIRAGETEVKKAEAELAVLKQSAALSSPKAVAAAEQAVTAANEKLARLTGPPDAVAVSAAQQEVAKAESDLSLLQARQDPPPTSAEISAARAAVEAAKAKRAQALGPPHPADVAAAMGDVKKAEADLEVLTRAASPESLAAAEASVDAVKLKLAKLESPPSAVDVRAARLELERTRSELQALRLGPSPAARRAAKQAVISSKTKLSQMSASPIEIARLKVEDADARSSAAQSAVSLLTVRSPWGGTVTALLSVPGTPVERTTPIAVVTDLDALAVDVDLSEFDVAQVKLGQQAVVSVDALGGKAFPGKVAFIALTGTETAGVVTYPVRVSLSSSGGLKPGMNVSVRILVAQKDDVLQVPLEAVTRDEDDNAVVSVVDESGQETERKVELGLANNESVEVVKGLREGENVVIPEPAPGPEEP